MVEKGDPCRKVLNTIKNFDKELARLRFSEITPSALSFIQRRLGIEHASVALLQEEKNGFLIYDAVTGTKTLGSGEFLRFTDTPITEAVKLAKPFYCPDIKKQDSKYEVDRILLQAGFRSYFLVPLIVNDKCAGTLNTASKKVNGFSDSKRQVLQFLAPRLAQAIQTALYIEELEKNKNALKDSLSQWQATFDTVTDSICLLDKEQKIQRCNKAMLNFLNKSEAEVTGRPCWEIVHGVSKPIPECPCLRKTRQRESLELNAGERWLEITVDPILDKSGSFTGAVHIIRDITKRKRAEEALLESEQRYRKLISSVTDYIYTVEVKDGRPVSTRHGSACVAVTGYTSEEYESDPYLWFRMVYEEDREQVIRQAERVLSGEDIQPLEHRIVHKNGQVKWVRNTPVPLYDQEGRLVAYDGLIVDITERKKAEEALQASERKFHSLYNSMTELMVLHEIVFDSSGNAVDYRLLDCNPSFTKITGITREKAVGALASQLYGSGEAPYLDIYAHVAETGEPVHFETYFPPMKKHFTISVFSPAKGYFATVASDTTERKEAEAEKLKLQEQLIQAQKMEAIGMLAGGVAHDFNNILTAIIGYGNLVKMKLAKDDPLKVNLDHILASSERGANLTQSLLAFSRKQLISPAPVDLNQAMRNMQKLLGRLIGEDIELKLVLDERPLTILADSGQIEQILMNLATNAKDAMPDGGSLIIKTEMTVIDEQFMKEHGFGIEGPYAMLSVTDSGTGMTEKTRERIFEPFFTTKEVGRGTGLGLAMVYGAIKQNNGYITADSELGKGTTFRIYLPLIKAAGNEEKTAEPLALIKGGAETILMAEDDESLRKLVSSVLQEFGYSVIEAKDGADAIEKFKEHKEDIKLAVLDVIMPKKNGREVYGEIKKINPGIKALFISGYTADLMHVKGIIDLNLNFLAKPVLPSELLKKIREILDEAAKN
ncbi:MAG: PAS domain S-box protein [Nitrospirae bacterium]|nr:PAS domain S-box protein [Nitrospirota bacterium]